jgi:FKBP-type peptidyl-prolyl cis-trans isomerase SlyD
MHEVGDVVTISLAPKEAFGHRDPARVLEVSSDDFPPDVQPGDRFEVENEDGGILVLSVLEVGEGFVVVDSNHPLCEQTVKLVVTVLEVRPATEEELSAALSEAEEAAAAAAGDGANLSSPLVPLERLLKGRPKS